MLSIVDEHRLRRLLRAMLDPDEFLSDHGLRALSRRHHGEPAAASTSTASPPTLDYEPGESTSGLFGGNSNWRGPVWFPINYLLIEALRVYDRFLGDAFKVECPTGCGTQLSLGEVADELAGRLIGIFRRREDGSRPVFGDYRAVPGRPGLARPDPVPRVLPRRHRRRSRRLAPDRLDRSRRGPDHPPRAGLRVLGAFVEQSLHRLPEEIESGPHHERDQGADEGILAGATRRSCDESENRASGRPRAANMPPSTLRRFQQRTRSARLPAAIATPAAAADNCYATAALASHASRTCATVGSKSSLILRNSSWRSSHSW